MPISSSADLRGLLEGLEKTVVFPGRVRLFCTDQLCHLLDAGLANGREWPGASAGVLLAAAAGAAFQEAARSGQVVVICPRPDGEDVLWWQAVALVASLGLPNLRLLLADGVPADEVRLRAAGWNVASGPASSWSAAAAMVEMMPLTGDRVTTSATSSTAQPSSAAVPRREWQPVRLASLLVGGVPMWPLSDPQPSRMPAAAQLVDSWLTALAGQEVHLLIAHQAEPWCRQAVNQALLVCLAHLASEGLRVCWRLPAATALVSWCEALTEISRRALAMKLVIEASDLPALDRLRTLPGWWVLAPSVIEDTASVLTYALDTEDAVLMCLPPAQPARPRVEEPSAHAYVPGSGRWLYPGGRITLVCDSRSLAATQRGHSVLAEARIGASILICTSLQPLPVTQLREAGNRGPMLVVGVGGAGQGLVEGIRQVLGASAVHLGLIDLPDAHAEPAADAVAILHAAQALLV